LLAGLSLPARFNKKYAKQSYLRGKDGEKIWLVFFSKKGEGSKKGLEELVSQNSWWG
jgi:hypothetical protein